MKKVKLIFGIIITGALFYSTFFMLPTPMLANGELHSSQLPFQWVFGSLLTVLSAYFLIYKSIWGKK